MCRLVRQHSPRSTIVVGGHVTAIAGIDRMIDADHIVRGEGVSWMREFLGEDPERPMVHPQIPSSFGFRLMGLPSRAAAAVPRRRSCRLWAARSAATSARPRRFSAARDGSSNLADIHGQFKFNFRHQAIARDQSKVLLDRAFGLDYERNGPSLYRLMRLMQLRWRRYRADPDPRVRARVGVAATQLRAGYGAALWAMERYLRRSNPSVSDRIRALRLETERDFGGWTSALNRTLGPVILWAARREASRAGAGSSRVRSWCARHPPERRRVFFRVNLHTSARDPSPGAARRLSPFTERTTR